jgi:hypothetical protein
MDLKITQVNKDKIIGGFSVKTTGDEENNNKNRKILFDDFIHNEKMGLLNNITKNAHEYYVATWIAEPPYIKYLLGQEVTDEKTDNLEFKVIKKGEYATKKIPPKHDSYSAWMEFYSEVVPGTGYKPVEQDDIAFEYYPNGFDGEYELWILVEKA